MAVTVRGRGDGGGEVTCEYLRKSLLSTLVARSTCASRDVVRWSSRHNPAAIPPQSRRNPTTIPPQSHHNHHHNHATTITCDGAVLALRVSLELSILLRSSAVTSESVGMMDGREPIL